MRAGMARYATAGINVETIAEYNEYCHFVAGLVGLGLSDLFSSCGYICKCPGKHVIQSQFVIICALNLTPCCVSYLDSCYVSLEK